MTGPNSNGLVQIETKETKAFDHCRKDPSSPARKPPLPPSPPPPPVATTIPWNDIPIYITIFTNIPS
ncbi:hypothetical protein LguiB_007308 [Lonicera macranthoides]